MIEQNELLFEFPYIQVKQILNYERSNSGTIVPENNETGNPALCPSLMHA
jgi:hypothetical protein